VFRHVRLHEIHTITLYQIVGQFYNEMSKERTSLINHDSSDLIVKTTPDHLPSQPIFILCDSCYWCATYMDKNRIPAENRCPQCNANNNELTSLPIMSNESFVFDYNDKHGVELEFKRR
jgi:hypothetical protein